MFLNFNPVSGVKSSVSSVISPASNAHARATIRQLGTGYVAPYHNKDSNGNGMRPVCGPFRATMNAGDTLGRQYLQCDCPNPLGSKRVGDSVSSRGCGIVVGGFTTKQVPVANCNPRKVYDSSDYTQFKKRQAQRKGYINNSRIAKNASVGGYILQNIQRLR
jgi:hypothetical protein